MTTEINKPKVLMISISHSGKSQYYRDRSSHSWKKRGFVVEHFEAITPVDINRSVEGRIDFLTFGKKRGVLNFTPTEKAIWYSMMLAIKQVAEGDEPYIIAEHDAMLLEDIPQSVFDDNSFVFLCHARHGMMTPCGAFYLTPEVARNVLDTHNYDEIITANCDGYLLGWWRNLNGVKEIKYVRQFINPKIGVTIDHKK